MNTLREKKNGMASQMMSMQLRGQAWQSSGLSTTSGKTDPMEENSAMVSGHVSCPTSRPKSQAKDLPTSLFPDWPKMISIPMQTNQVIANYLFCSEMVMHTYPYISHLRSLPILDLRLAHPEHSSWEKYPSPIGVRVNMDFPLLLIPWEKEQGDCFCEVSILGWSCLSWLWCSAFSCLKHTLHIWWKRSNFQFFL
jgi:hypothetical protein